MRHKDLITAYEFCLKNGWVHNTPKDTIIIDYEHRQELFKNHLDKIKNHLVKTPDTTIHILIGEAPPYYPNDIFPLLKHRKYFYDKFHSPNTPYFKKPCEYFLHNQKSTKEELLKQLAASGVLIFDIFPFPIFQTTDNRKHVNNKNNESKQSKIQKSSLINGSENAKSPKFYNFLDTYFCSRLEELLRNLKETPKVEFYLFAPKYTAIQFLSWCYLEEGNCEVKNRLKGSLVTFKNSGTGFKLKDDLNGFYSNDTTEFIKKIGDENIIKGAIKKHPIFMDKSGNPNFEGFINGSKNRA